MKDILVSIDSIDGFEASIVAALRIADTFDSHITCVYEGRFYGYSSYAECYADVIAIAVEKQLEQDEESVAQIYNECVKSREANCALKLERPLGPNTILSYANVSDLIVCAQHNPDKASFGDRNQPEHLVMGSGKPVLVIPYIGLPKTIGRNIIIAWDRSREASRAIHDAMPLLKQAETVHIFTMNTEKSGEGVIDTTDLLIHLGRHGVNVENNPYVVDDVPVAEMLLSRASDYDADLIVMGAYGHSRLREYTLGGTTRTILNSMTIPVLMTH